MVVTGNKKNKQSYQNSHDTSFPRDLFGSIKCVWSFDPISNKILSLIKHTICWHCQGESWIISAESCSGHVWHTSSRRRKYLRIFWRFYMGRILLWIDPSRPFPDLTGLSAIFNSRVWKPWMPVFDNMTHNTVWHVDTLTVPFFNQSTLCNYMVASTLWLLITDMIYDYYITWT